MNETETGNISVWQADTANVGAVVLADSVGLSSAGVPADSVASPLQVPESHAMDGIHLWDGSYFGSNRYFQPELGVGNGGVQGEPVPYTVSLDNTITALLLGCFIILLMAVSLSRSFLSRQAKNFFYVPRSVADMTETSMEIRVLYLLVFQTAVLLGVLFYLFTRIAGGSDYQQHPQLLVIGCFAGLALTSFLVRSILYGIINWIFFDRKKNEQWRRSWLFLSVAEGLVLYPFVLLTVYGGMPLHFMMYWTLIVMVLVKLLTFYKGVSIFFRRTGGFLQNILYFCALEIMPLVVLCGALIETSKYLEINF